MLSRKNLPWIEVTLVTLIMMLHVYAAFSDAYNLPNAWFTRDDAYYYFKVAQNITEGRGVSFDGLNPTNGFHPLWLALCIPVFALARFDLILPLRILLIASAALHASTVVLLFRLLRSALSTPVAVMAAAYWAFDLRLHYTFYEFGLESALALFALISFLYVMSRFDQDWRQHPPPSRRIVGLALVAAFMVFSRLDLIFVAVLAGAWIILRGRPARFLVPLDALVLGTSMLAAHALTSGFPAYFRNTQPALISTAVSVAVRCTLLLFLGQYRHPRTTTAGRWAGVSAAAALGGGLLGSAILLSLDAAHVIGGISRQALLVDGLLATGFLSIARYIAYGFSARTTGASPDAPRAPFAPPWHKLRVEALSYFGTLGGSVAIYMLANRLFFDTWLPISATIKRWWGAQVETIYDGPPRDLFAFFGAGPGSALNAWRPATDLIPLLAPKLRSLLPGTALREERYLLVIVAVLILALLLMLAQPGRTRRAVTQLGIIPLTAGAWLQILSYTALGYAGYKEWYWIPQSVLITIAAALLLQLATARVLRWRAPRYLMFGVAAAASMWMALNMSQTIYRKMPYGRYPIDIPYMDVLPFLESNTREGEIIGMTGGGNVGYFIRNRVIVNMDGLISSTDYFEALKARRAAAYLSGRGVRVVFVNPGLLALAPYGGQFDGYLERYATYYGKALLWLWPELKYPESAT